MNSLERLGEQLSGNLTQPGLGFKHQHWREDSGSEKKNNRWTSLPIINTRGSKLATCCPTEPSINMVEHRYTQMFTHCPKLLWVFPCYKEGPVTPLETVLKLFTIWFSIRKISRSCSRCLTFKSLSIHTTVHIASFRDWTMTHSSLYHL